MVSQQRLFASLSGFSMLTTLLENSLPIYAVGAVLATLCGLAFLARRNLASLLALIGVVVISLLLVLTEQMVVTEREEVEQALQQLMAAIESNSVSDVLALVDPAAAQMRGDVEKLMPEANIEDTGATAVKIDIHASTQPLTATARFRGRVDGVHRRSGQRVFYFDEVEMSWIKRADRWLVEGYAAQWRGKPLDAVNSMRGNRPSPATR